MKRYNITVNGTAYDVTVEEASADNAVKTAPAAIPVPAPSPAAITTAMPQAQEAKPAGIQGNIKIEAPMPGTIVDVKVKAGDNVHNGSVIAVLEAMKMENDIVAAEDGVITSVNVSKGESVNTGTVVATMSN